MQKKRVVTETTAQKQQLKNNLSTYIERYREIELYLTLLTKPLVSSVIAASPVGLNTLHDKVEAEIKSFLEMKLQVLTGLAQPISDSGLSSEEVSALKMVASSIIKKTPVSSKMISEEPKPEPVPVKVNAAPAPVVEEPEEEETPAMDAVVETESVVVEQVEGAALLKRNRKRQKEVVDPRTIPNVQKGEATDTMKKSRPMGVKPLPPPPLDQANTMALQQAEAMHTQILEAQMRQAETVLPDNLGMPNLNGAMFR